MRGGDRVLVYIFLKCAIKYAVSGVVFNLSAKSFQQQNYMLYTIFFLSDSLLFS